MTAQIEFRLTDKIVANGETLVAWVCGVYEGTKTSTGIGSITVQSDLSAATDEEVLEAAITAHGGPQFVSGLLAFHTASLVECVNLQVADDWYLAYTFCCSKTGAPCDTKAAALENMAHGFGNYGVEYNHSIFNVNTGGHWSHTFAYTVIENGEQVIYHIKVRQGEVVEWYKSSPSLAHNGEPVEWVSLDLSSGQTFEFYKRVQTETPGVTRMEKFNASNNELATVTTHGPFGGLELPEDFQSLLAAAGFRHGATVFGYATKSYGRIVEYTLRTPVVVGE